MDFLFRQTPPPPINTLFHHRDTGYRFVLIECKARNVSEDDIVILQEIKNEIECIFWYFEQRHC